MSKPRLYSGIKLPFFSKLKVRGKILFGFTITIIIFTLGLIMAYNSSLEISNINNEILDRNSVVQAQSIEITSYFEEQVGIMVNYALNGGSTQEEFQNISDMINLKLVNLSPLIQNDPEASEIYTKIEENQDIWNNIVENKVFSIPNSQILGDFLSTTQKIQFFEAELNSNMLSYLTTGRSAYKNRITLFEREIENQFKILDTQKPVIQTINSSIFDNYNTYLEKFTVKYYEWFTEIVSQALLLGDNYSSILGAGDYSIITDFIHDKGTFIYDTNYYIDVLILNVDYDNQLLEDYQKEAVNTKLTLQDHLESLKSHSQAIMEAQRVQSTDANFIALTATILALFVGVSLSVLIGFIISSGISRPLSKLTEDSKLISQGDLSIVIEVEDEEEGDELIELSKSFKNMINFLIPTIEEIRKVSIDLASAAQEMASSSEEVNASSEEISSITQQMSKGAQDQTNHIADSKSSANSLKNNFNQKVAEINSIANLIDKLAKQVNMLALNASIEAARAGEYGRGFSVVADNIRGLADDTNKSVNNVKVSIKSLNDVLSESINQITQSIEKVAIVAEETASGSEEASAATEEQVATMEELTGSAQELANMASKLEQMINLFKIS